MLEDALRYPLRGDAAAGRLAIGGALPLLGFAISIVGFLLLFLFVGVFLLPVAIVPRIILWGYLVSVVAAVLVGRTEPPAFTDWKQLAFDGVKAIAISTAYVIPLVVGIIVLTVTIAVIAPTGMQAADGGLLFDLLWMGITFVALAYSLAMYYLLPVAVVNFVREDDLTAAFDLETISDIALSSEYLVAWLLAVAVLLVGGVVAFPLYFVLVGFALRFYTLVAAAYLLTRGVMDAAGWSAPESAPPEPPGDASPESGPTPAVTRVETKTDGSD